MILAKELKWLVGRWIAFMNESADALLSCCHRRVDYQRRHQFDADTDRSDRIASLVFLAPDRSMLFTARAGLPDFSAISRSCSSMTARAGTSPSGRRGFRLALCDWSVESRLRRPRRIR